MWRPILEFQNYECNELGEIRRKQLYGHPKLHGTILRPTVGKNGYLFISLRRDGHTHTGWVHKVICTVFHGEKPSAHHQVAHYDGNRKNNTPDNLRWATAKENAHDRNRHGTTRQGEDINTNVLTREQALSILVERAAIKRSGKSVYGFNRRQSEKYGVSNYCIQDLIYRRSWKHLQKELN